MPGQAHSASSAEFPYHPEHSTAAGYQPDRLLHQRSILQHAGAKPSRALSANFIASESPKSWLSADKADHHAASPTMGHIWLVRSILGFTLCFFRPAITSASRTGLRDADGHGSFPVRIRAEAGERQFIHIVVVVHPRGAQGFFQALQLRQALPGSSGPSPRKSSAWRHSR